jgi:hypothetical protein
VAAAFLTLMPSPPAEAVAAQATAVGAAQPPRPAIFSPVVDLLCVGGLSILLIVPMLLSGREDLAFLNIGVLIWMQALINYSHFMASYRIIYRDREMIRRHRWAAIWMPMILLGYALLALWQAQQQRPLLVGVMVAVGSGYLAWHYTGQVWGMMASYTYLAGGRIDKSERLLIRSSLRILLVWHLVWFVNIWFRQTSLPEPFWLVPLYQAVTAATLLAAVLGGLGILKIRLRSGSFPPARALVAWIAIFVWYAAMWRWGLPALFLVQLAHAIQYLEFPARVELNRATRTAATRATGHMALYGAGLLAASFLVVLAVPGPAMSVVAGFLGLEPNKVAPVLILTFINIHHYFTDGVAWKLGNPEVRKDLFSHVNPATVPLPAGPAGPANPAGGKRKRRPVER